MTPTTKTSLPLQMSRPQMSRSQISRSQISRSQMSRSQMSRISSDTNLAVQLLLSVSDCHHVRSSNPHILHRKSNSATSTDVPADASDDSLSTDAVITPTASPRIRQTTLTPSATSPHGVHPTFTRSDATFFKYNREERQEALKRFREKKMRRQFRKRVRYMVRKRLAETRPRYKGRFSKPPPGENYDDGTPGPLAASKSSKSSQSSQSSRYHAAVSLKKATA